MAVSVGLTGLVLAGCERDEQDRPLTYDKGVYGGAPDSELDEAQIRALQYRADQQRF